MVKRKGVGYMIEVIAALLVMFTFIIGNTPSEPATDWSVFQKEIAAQDITYTLEKTGDINSFVRNSERGSLATAGETLSRREVELSGSIENIPISTQTVGFHTRPVNRLNASLDTVENLNDQCYQDDDLEELDSEYDKLRTENSKAGAYIYVTDTDPSISGDTNDEKDYDTIWVDNGTRCQFSSSEGPYYIDDFIYWGDGSGGHHWDINEIYDSDRRLELFNATQIVRMRPELESRLNGVDTGVTVDTAATEKEDLDSYDILVFREQETLETGVLNSEKNKIQEFLSRGSILLMMDLNREHFYDSNDNPKDNFITDTGLKWVDLPYRTTYRDDPGDNIGGQYGLNSDAEELETYFRGKDGETGKLNLTPGGNITSSNSKNFKNSEPLLSTAKGSYRTIAWNSSNSSMEPVDPTTVDGYPSTACVEEGTTDRNLTLGTFEFQDYQSGDTVEYKVLNTKLGEDKQFCRDNDVRALNLDLSKDGEEPPDIISSEYYYNEGDKESQWSEGYTSGNPDMQKKDNSMYVQGESIQGFWETEQNLTNVDRIRAEIQQSGCGTASGCGRMTLQVASSSGTDKNTYLRENRSSDGSTVNLTVDVNSLEGDYWIKSGLYNDYGSFDKSTSVNIYEVEAQELERNNPDFSDQGEGPYLNGESVSIKNKRYTVHFPTELAVKYGNYSEFIYTGKSDIENINYRTSFNGFQGKKLARMEYKEDYNKDERKMISAVIHWLSDDTSQFGDNAERDTTTEAVGGVKEQIFMPYKISLRWK